MGIIGFQVYNIFIRGDFNMNKKLVAIGGGENGRKLNDDKFFPYETKTIDAEIVSLTKKKNPNFLFIVHSQSNSLKIQEEYFQTMKKVCLNVIVKI